MSEHTYLTPESLSILGSCSPTGPFAIAVHWIIADLAAVRAELKAAQEERQSALDALAVALHERNQRDAEIARLRQNSFIPPELTWGQLADAAEASVAIRHLKDELAETRTALKEIEFATRDNDLFALIHEVAVRPLNPQPAQEESEEPEMSEHKYLTPKETEFIRYHSVRFKWTTESDTKRLIDYISALRDELKVAQEESRKNLELWDADAKDKDAEIARLREEYKAERGKHNDTIVESGMKSIELAEIRTALEDANSIADSYARNKNAMTLALRRAGLPDSWLSGWDSKFDRIRALNPQPAQPEKPKPQTFREGHPVYVCRQCSKQYKEHGKNEECPVGERDEEPK